jgi:hypothetical protein
VTRDRARKKTIRARVAASGEPYSVAARKLAAAGSPGGAPPGGEVIARAQNTLAAPSARIGLRVNTHIVRPERPERRRPGPAGRLARFTARAAWDRIASAVDATRLRDTFRHQAGAGYLEPAAGRYLIDYGGYAEMCIDGRHFGGQSGHLREARHRRRRPPRPADDPLGLLRLLLDPAPAHRADDEMVRGTLCRSVAVEAADAGLMVWIDDEHIRRIQVEDHAEAGRSSVSKVRTLELWDFGVPVDSLDWSRLPSLRPGGGRWPSG